MPRMAASFCLGCLVSISTPGVARKELHVCVDFEDGKMQQPGGHTLVLTFNRLRMMYCTNM